MINFKAIFSSLHDVFCVLRVITDDPDNLHCHSQELILVAGILAQGPIIAFKNSNILIEIKALSLLLLPHRKKIENGQLSRDVRDTHSVHILVTPQ